VIGWHRRQGIRLGDFPEDNTFPIMAKISNIVHFVFGLREQWEPFHLMYYLAIESARQVLKPELFSLAAGVLASTAGQMSFSSQVTASRLGQ